MPARARKFDFQYRLVWKYRGEHRPRYFVADRPASVLRMLRRVATDQPELGVTPTQFKRAWAWLARRIGVSFPAVAEIPPAEILIRLRDSFPRLEYVRVEQRQVGAWAETLDPLVTLRTPAIAKSEAKRQELVNVLQTFTREQLDAWRWVPNEQAQAVRTRGDQR